MPNPSAPHPDRRQFLRMLAASPALPYVTLSPKLLHALGQEPFREGGPAGELIGSPEEALTVFDFEAVAKEKLHYGHVAFLGGTEDEGTYRANREGFTQYQLRVRRLVDISRIDMSVSLFGSSAHSPNPPLPLRRAQRLPPGRRGGGGPRGAHAGAHHDALERGEPADRGRGGGPRRARLVPALPRRRLEPDAGHDQAGRGGRLARAGLDHRQPGRRQADRARARPAPRPARSAAPATR